MVAMLILMMRMCQPLSLIHCGLPNHACPALETPGPCLNIKTVFPRYGGSHVKDETVGETVLSLTWESLYW